MEARLVDPKATVSGGNILSMLAAMGPFRKRGEQILAEVGIDEVDAERWYPLPAYVKALEAIETKMGPNTLLQIGKQIPNHVMLPPGLDTFEKVLASFGMAYDMNHRGIRPNAITFTVKTDRHADIVSGTAYPCDFDRGVIQGFFQKLLATRVNVVHDTTGGCKKQGGETCMHHVTLVA
ncbi:MAG TPA: hypothetical protein VFE05_06275 [Longimicrobiaceae bacterium]|jgi:hypothetical protein|nr:hypothetical protein [Longimicrobiaceae bacterium]